MGGDYFASGNAYFGDPILGFPEGQQQQQQMVLCVYVVVCVRFCVF
jgi:hypothetical protein